MRRLSCALLAAATVLAAGAQATDVPLNLVIGPLSEDRPLVAEFSLAADLNRIIAVELLEEHLPGIGEKVQQERVAALMLPPPVMHPQETQASPSTDDPFAASPKARRRLVGPCDTACKLWAGVFTVVGAATLAYADVDTSERVGDITQFLTPVVGLAMTYPAKDREGRKQFWRAAVTTTVAVHGMKNTIDKARPNEGDKKSFPSGHTASSFFGAGFIHDRYGPRWGVPAYVLAAYTGVSRVNAQKHFMDDVISGMSIGLMSNWLWTSPISERVAINPMLTEGGYGLTVEIQLSDDTPSRTTAIEDTPRRRVRFRYEWEFGDVHVNENFVQAPAEGGDPIDFRFSQTNDPAVSGHAEIEWFPKNDRHGVTVRLTPYELRDFGSLEEDINFVGETYPSGMELRTAYVAYDWRMRYRYDVLPSGWVDLKVGAGVSLLETVAELTPLLEPAQTGAQTTDIEDFVVLPIVHLHLGVKLGRRFKIFAEGDVVELDRDRYIDAAAILRYQAGTRWDLGIGYRYFERDIDTDEMRNKHQRDQGIIAVGYRF
jgi:hypothetical protein